MTLCSKSRNEKPFEMAICLQEIFLRSSRTSLDSKHRIQPEHNQHRTKKHIYGDFVS